MFQKIFKVDYWTVMIFFMFFILIGCSNNDDDFTLNDESTGYFLDAAVEGLKYKCDIIEAKTGYDGSFRYIEGKTIEFFVGDISLGSGSAKTIMTPVDIVEGATSPTNENVVKICQFLLSCDSNIDDDTITLSDSVHYSTTNKTIDFSRDITDTVNSILGYGKLVDKSTAIDHFTNTFNGKDIALSPSKLTFYTSGDEQEEEILMITDKPLKSWSFTDCMQSNACACVGHEDIEEKEFFVYPIKSFATECIIEITVKLTDETEIKKKLPVSIVDKSENKGKSSQETNLLTLK